MKESLKKPLRIAGKVLKWILIFFTVLFLLVFIVWKVPAVHDFAVKKGTEFFNKKTGGNLSIGEVDLKLPFFIGLENIRLDRPNGQKLASVESLEVFPGWRMLLTQTIRVDEINLTGVDGKIFVKRDGSFNFDFIVNGFADTTAVTEEPVDTSASAWTFSLGDLNLSEVDFVYTNRTTGDSIDLSVGGFTLDMDELDLNAPAYLAEGVTIENTAVFAAIPASESPPDEEPSAALPAIGLEELDILDTKIALKLGDEPAYRFNLGTVHLETDKIDLNSTVYEVSKLLLADSQFLIPLPEGTAQSEPEEPSPEQDGFFPDLMATVAELTIENVSVKAFAKGDTLHRLSDFNIAAKGVEAGTEGYALKLEKLSGTYNDFSDLKTFQGDFAFRQNEAKAADVVLRYGSSSIDLNALLSYESVDALLEKSKFTNLNAAIDEAHITPRDIERVYAALDMDTLPVPSSDIYLSLNANGNKEKVDLNKFMVKTGSSSVGINALYFAGRDSLWPGDLNLNNLNIALNRRDLNPFMDYLGIAREQIPTRLSVNAIGAYNSKKAKLKGKITSPYGNVSLNVTGDGWGSKKQSMRATVKSDLLKIGEYLGMPDALEADFNLLATTENLGDTLVDICTELTVDTLKYAAYTYTDLMLDAEVFDNNALFAFAVNDTFVRAEMGGAVDFANSIDATVEGKIFGIDLEGLKYAEKDIRGTFDFYAHYITDSLTTDARASFDEILFVKEGDRYPFRPMDASFYTGPDSTSAHFKSGFMQLNSVSNRGVDSLVAAISEVLARGENNTTLDTGAFWKADFYTSDLGEIGELFLPELRDFQPSKAEINFSAKDNELLAEAYFPGFRYGAIALDSLFINSSDVVAGNKRSLHIGRLAYDSLALRSIDLTAERTTEGADLLLTINPDTNDNHYRIRAELTADSTYIRNGFIFHFNDTLVLNGKKWNYEDQCCIRSTEKGLSLEAFRLFRNDRSLSLAKEGDGSPLEITAENFPVGSVLGMVNTEVDLINGLLYGHLKLNKDGSFEGDGNITDFKVSGADFGKLTWQASRSEGVLKTNIHNQGDMVDFAIDGDISPKSDSTSALDLTFRLNKFRLKTLEKVLHNSVADASGNLTGEVSITGTNLDTDLDGSLKLTSAKVRPRGSQMSYTVENDEIFIKPDRVRFDKFQIRDETQSELTLDGKVTHDNFTDPKMDLRIYGQDFTLVDWSEESDAYLYGKVVADLDLDITGELDAPEVDAEIRINEPTDFTYVITSSTSAEAFDNSLLVWTNFEENPGDEIITREKNEAAIEGNVFANNPKIKGELFIDKSAIFQVVVDTTAGDYLQIRGSSRLSIDYDRTGTLRFNGVYEVEDGFYQMSFYDVVKRRFDFRKGSRLVWNGEPTNANINITAAYQTRAGIANLMLTDPSASFQNSFQQQLPFEVLLNIDGKLLEPEISFGIELGEGAGGSANGSVQARLNDLTGNESELNKQVFALLILGSFLPQSGGPDDAAFANQARNSASQILTNQLNNLSDKYVKGVDINFDLYSYGGNAGQGNTDLNVNLAKSFADDRIVVKVGSTIALEEDNARAAQSQQVMTNVEVEYKLTPDGRYRLIGFSKTDLEDIVIGRITRSGGGFVFQKDFDRFRYLFHPEEKEENVIGIGGEDGKADDIGEGGTPKKEGEE